MRQALWPGKVSQMIFLCENFSSKHILKVETSETDIMIARLGLESCYIALDSTAREFRFLQQLDQYLRNITSYVSF
eukprot:g51059.t1